MSLQFKPLERLRSSHLGILWEVLRQQGFTKCEDHMELESALEEFEEKPEPRIGVRVQTFDDAPPLPRVWFLNDSQNELIQFQRDRLIVNWRRGAEHELYPRYESIRRRFVTAWEVLARFVNSEQLGDIRPNQCELTYVNHLISGEGWDRHGAVDRVCTVWSNRYSDDYLGQPEDAGFRMRYRMLDNDGAPVGRLHVTLQPAFRAIDGVPILVLTLTGRGQPSAADLNSALKLFDEEHTWIVRGFASVTTPTMHEIWRRIDVR